MSARTKVFIWIVAGACYILLLLVVAPVRAQEAVSTAPPPVATKEPTKEATVVKEPSPTAETARYTPTVDNSRNTPTSAPVETPTSNVPTVLPSDTAVPTVTVSAYVPPPPPPPGVVLVEPTPVPCGEFDDPCYSRVYLPVMSEFDGAAYLGCVIILGLLFHFLGAHVRLVLGGLLCVCILLSALSGAHAWLYGWLVSVWIFAFPDGIFRFAAWVRGRGRNASL